MADRLGETVQTIISVCIYVYECCGLEKKKARERGEIEEWPQRTWYHLRKKINLPYLPATMKLPTNAVYFQERPERLQLLDSRWDGRDMLHATYGILGEDVEAELGPQIPLEDFERDLQEAGWTLR